MTRIIFICLLCLAFQEAFSQSTTTPVYPRKWVNQSKTLISSEVKANGKTKKRDGFSFTAEYKFIDKIDTKDIKVFRVLTLHQTKKFTTDFTETSYKISDLEYHTSDYASKKWLDTVSYSINIDNTINDRIPTAKKTFTPFPQIPKKHAAEITLEDRDYVFLDRKKMLSKYRSLKYPAIYLDLESGLSAAKRFLLITQTQVSNYNPIDARRRNERVIFAYAASFKIGVLNWLAHSFYVEGQFIRQGFSGYELDWNTGLTSGTTRNSYIFNSYGVGIGYSYNNYRKIHGLAMDASLGYYWIKAKVGDVDQSEIKDNQLIGKFALGYKRRIGPDTDLRIMPTLYTNFNAINKIDAGLNTSLFNLGISFGIRKYLFQRNYKPSPGNFPKIVSEVKYVKSLVKSETTQSLSQNHTQQNTDVTTTNPPANTKNEPQLLLGLYKAPTNVNEEMKDSLFGGISGIEYDATNKVWYLVTDGREEDVRQSYLYKCPNKDGLFPDWENCKSIKLPGINVAESVRYSDKDKSLYFSTEKDKKMGYKGTDKIKVFYKYKIDDDEIENGSIKSKHIETLPIKANYKPDRGFESLYIEPGVLWSIREHPVNGEDSTKLTSWKIDKNKVLKEYSYKINIDSCSLGQNGITEILYDGEYDNFLIMERCYNSTDKPKVNTVILYEAKIVGNKMVKKRIFNFRDSLSVNSDNIEGMTWGPRIDGKRTIVFISDDNFNKASQKTNFIILKEK